jgi:hypothetical protein
MNFAVSLVLLSTYSAAHGIQVGFCNTRGAYVQANRERGVRKALELGAEYIFFIDSDMSFPDNALMRLLKADQAIVGATYVRRAPPYDNLAKTNGGDQSVSGLHELERIPTGMLLIKVDVFKTIPEPWFETNWNKEKNDFDGEDYAFCDLARRHGYKIWMDCDLSAEVIHWGEMGFKWTGEGKGYALIPEIV